MSFLCSHSVGRLILPILLLQAPIPQFFIPCWTKGMCMTTSRAWASSGRPAIFISGYKYPRDRPIIPRSIPQDKCILLILKSTKKPPTPNNQTQLFTAFITVKYVQVFACKASLFCYIGMNPQWYHGECGLVVLPGFIHYIYEISPLVYLWDLRASLC